MHVVGGGSCALSFRHSLGDEKLSEENKLKKIKRERLDKMHVLILIFLNPCSSLRQQLDVQNLNPRDLIILKKNRKKENNLYEESEHTEA